MALHIHPRAFLARVLVRVVRGVDSTGLTLAVHGSVEPGLEIPIVPSDPHYPHLKDSSSMCAGTPTGPGGCTRKRSFAFIGVTVPVVDLRCGVRELISHAEPDVLEKGACLAVQGVPRAYETAPPP